MFFDLWNYIIDEHNGDTVNTLIQIGTFIIAVLTWFGAVIGGIHSLRDIKINRRNKQLSEFIALFSDENETKRLRGSMELLVTLNFYSGNCFLYVL